MTKKNELVKNQFSGIHLFYTERKKLFFCFQNNNNIQFTVDIISQDINCLFYYSKFENHSKLKYIFFQSINTCSATLAFERKVDKTPCNLFNN